MTAHPITVPLGARVAEALDIFAAARSANCRSSMMTADRRACSISPISSGSPPNPRRKASRMSDEELNAIAGRIELLVLDVDGVLTDGSIMLTPDGGEIKTFHVRDGSALTAWRRCGKKTAIISGSRFAGRFDPSRRIGDHRGTALRQGQGRRVDRGRPPRPDRRSIERVRSGMTGRTCRF